MATCSRCPRSSSRCSWARMTAGPPMARIRIDSSPTNDSVGGAAREVDQPLDDPGIDDAVVAEERAEVGDAQGHRAALDARDLRRGPVQRLGDLPLGLDGGRAEAPQLGEELPP